MQRYCGMTSFSVEDFRLMPPLENSRSEELLWRKMLNSELSLSRLPAFPAYKIFIRPGVLDHSMPRSSMEAILSPSQQILYFLLVIPDLHSSR